MDYVTISMIFIEKTWAQDCLSLEDSEKKKSYNILQNLHVLSCAIYFQQNNEVQEKNIGV